MKHFKYIHFFWHDDLKFNPRIVKMINESDNGFNVEEHLFVTPHRRVYEAISEYDNVVLYETDNPFSAKMINYFAPYGDWLILHSMPAWMYALRIKRKYWKKIIWRTWGHEFRYHAKQGQPLKNFAKKIVNYLIKREVRGFFGIGIANTVDEIDIRQRFGNVRMFQLSYPQKGVDEILASAVKHKRSSSSLNIMVGHSGHPEDNHIAIMDLLKKYKNENIQLYVVLSYGNLSYIEEIKNYINKNWQDKSTIIDRFLPYEEYINLCADMDILILDGVRSYALGNVAPFLYLRKKFFLNRDGILHKAFVQESIPHSCSQEILDLDFAAFSSKIEYPSGKRYSLESPSYKDYINRWHKLISVLKNDE